MKKLRIILVVLTVITFTSCKKNNSEKRSTEEVSTYSEDETTDEYPDGTYCADIDYYNPDTGTSSTYTLNVEVESNEVTVIQWSNGGWLDSSHFNPEELDSNGSCSFTTFDGKQYDIQITGPECSSTDENAVSSNDYYEKQKITCPECGGKKDSYNDICDDCEDKEEHTCKKCGEYDAFMFSTDDMCSDCEKAEKDRLRKEEENEE